MKMDATGASELLATSEDWPTVNTIFDTIISIPFPFQSKSNKRLDHSLYMSQWVMFELEPAFVLNSGATVE